VATQARCATQRFGELQSVRRFLSSGDMSVQGKYQAVAFAHPSRCRLRVTTVP